MGAQAVEFDRSASHTLSGPPDGQRAPGRSELDRQNQHRQTETAKEEVLVNTK